MDPLLCGTVCVDVYVRVSVLRVRRIRHTIKGLSKNSSETTGEMKFGAERRVRVSSLHLRERCLILKKRKLVFRVDRESQEEKFFLHK